MRPDAFTPLQLTCSLTISTGGLRIGFLRQFANTARRAHCTKLFAAHGTMVIIMGLIRKSPGSLPAGLCIFRIERKRKLPFPVESGTRIGHCEESQQFSPPAMKAPYQRTHFLLKRQRSSHRLQYPYGQILIASSLFPSAGIILFRLTGIFSAPGYRIRKHPDMPQIIPYNRSFFLHCRTTGCTGLHYSKMS